MTSSIRLARPRLVELISSTLPVELIQFDLASRADQFDLASRADQFDLASRAYQFDLSSRADSVRPLQSSSPGRAEVTPSLRPVRPI